eukprot:TRINITY_DN358_c0_g1_i7.p1 TRINITY_DN358_c0_g1~~TRINITY_DN358_c0_g1_i7.p1  ORF type:complete len:605 (+),score=115.93 TRINITY_DN358_c0_g1_i7:154-1815(+)
MQQLLFVICLSISLTIVSAQSSTSAANIIASAVSSGGAAEAIAEAAAEGTRGGSVIVEGIAQAQADGNGEVVAAGFADAIVEANGCECPLVDAIAQAIAESLVTVGPEAQATLAALEQAQATGGCDAISVVLAAAQVIAIGLGEAQAFAETVAIAGLSNCLPNPPATPSRSVAIVTAIANPAVYGGVLVNTLNEAEGNAEATSNGIASALISNTEVVAEGLGQAIADGGSVSVVSESLAKLARYNNIETLATSIAEIAGKGQAVAVAEAIAFSVATDSEVTAQAIAEALSDSENGEAVAEAVSEALSSYWSQGLVEAVTQAIAESIDGGNAKAVGRAIASLTWLGEISAVVEVVATAIEGGLAEAVADAIAEALNYSFFQGDPRVISSMAKAVAEAAANSKAVAESMGRAVAYNTIEAEVTAQVFAEAVATENADAFVTGFAQTVSKYDRCDTVVEALGEAFVLGVGEAVVEAATQAGCVDRPYIQFRQIYCSSLVRPCRTSTENCCQANIADLRPGQTCDDTRRSTYAGVCSNDVLRVVLQGRVGSGCYCQF